VAAGVEEVGCVAAVGSGVLCGGSWQRPQLVQRRVVRLCWSSLLDPPKIPPSGIHILCCGAELPQLQLGFFSVKTCQFVVPTLPQSVVALGHLVVVDFLNTILLLKNIKLVTGKQVKQVKPDF